MTTKLHLHQTFSHEFQPLQLFLSDHPHCEDAEHFFREFPLEKRTIFFGEKMRSTTRGSVNGGKLTFFFAGVLARNPLDFISFSAAENHIFFAEAAGLTRLVLSILSVLSPSYSTNYKQFLL